MSPSDDREPACFVCRCEEIEASTIRAAITAGAMTLNDLKRRTRAGMGLCQGLFCLPAMASLLHQETGIPRDQIVPMTARSPVRPISLDQLAVTAPETS